MDIKFYIAKKTSNTWSNKHELLLNYVSDNRKEKINRYIFENDKITSLYAAILTRLGIVKHFNCNNSELIFDKTKTGKPILKFIGKTSLNNVDFNFSHTKTAVLLGIVFEKNYAIGVDIECLKKAPFDIMPMVFHPLEIDFVNSFHGDMKNQAFFEIWTKKEAYTKCIGTGLVNNPCSINTLSASLNDTIYTWQYEDYICSACILYTP
ncbi:4'-phosphopantetheinyl transferase [Pseudobutyrivibrio sp. UC1225]|uniref:4'-phosphopantetheinyl transferase family protein n=1 Tax=Pseudobutyrivibrio sp. UC1225 TaxID=1798185 RepID=UPI0008EE6685|nr:4'-phosphopantetheinyl transferase superfamily protein [Pseudobutyrivibrio sp. UC1225]SFO35978.1 4'-phosphopantetheinyl transferase [Pseudobutyrivibrio sp. UC1225]